MTQYFQDELEQVKEKVLRLGSIVEVMVENAVTSLVDRTPAWPMRPSTRISGRICWNWKSTRPASVSWRCTSPPPAICAS